MQITVKSVCRLHLGFLDLRGDLGRSYGSIGVALRIPRTIVTADRAEHLIIENGNRNRIMALVERFSQHYRVQPKVRIRLLDTIPEHSGLGSGTQLALAVATVLAMLYDIEADPYGISSIMGRGKRSGVGIAGFESGGFIIDSGRKSASPDGFEALPKVIFRHDFPADWCFVLAIPERTKGLSGGEEDQAMSHLKPSRKISEEICRLTQIKLLPSLIDRDIVEFGEALTEIDIRNGMFFEGVQGGIYRGQRSSNLLQCMLDCGAYGGGQSSWGPTIYGLVEIVKAQHVADKVRDFFIEQGMSGKVLVSHGSNKGAEISMQRESSNVDWRAAVTGIG